MFILIMGVSGCGKTTLGEYFAKKYGWTFVDADKFHSKENIEKMTKGLPLFDEDRIPWLQSLHSIITRWEEKGHSGVLACSALKEEYRKILIYGNNNEVRKAVSEYLIVYLTGDKEVIRHRMACRKGHFMSETMLDSQYQILEEPDNTSLNTLWLSIENTVEDNAKAIARNL